MWMSVWMVAILVTRSLSAKTRLDRILVLVAKGILDAELLEHALVGITLLICCSVCCCRVAITLCLHTAEFYLKKRKEKEKTECPPAMFGWTWLSFFSTKLTSFSSEKLSLQDNCPPICTSFFFLQSWLEICWPSNNLLSGGGGGGAIVLFRTQTAKMDTQPMHAQYSL